MSLQMNVGKGGHWLFPFLLSKYHLSPSEACIIGDRLDTDIAMGKEGKMVTILPLTGEGRLGVIMCTYPAMFHSDAPLTQCEFSTRAKPSACVWCHSVHNIHLGELS